MFTEDASTLGIPAGVWPFTITYHGLTFYRLRKEFKDKNGDIVYVEYQTAEADRSRQLRVYND